MRDHIDALEDDREERRSEHRGYRILEESEFLISARGCRCVRRSGRRGVRVRSWPFGLGLRPRPTTGGDRVCWRWGDDRCVGSRSRRGRLHDDRRNSLIRRRDPASPRIFPGVRLPTHRSRRGLLYRRCSFVGPNALRSSDGSREDGCFGVSASGELALALGLRHPDIFGSIWCASPGAGYRRCESDTGGEHRTRDTELPQRRRKRGAPNGAWGASRNGGRRPLRPRTWPSGLTVTSWN